MGIRVPGMGGRGRPRGGGVMCKGTGTTGECESGAMGDILVLRRKHGLVIARIR